MGDVLQLTDAFFDETPKPQEVFIEALGATFLLTPIFDDFVATLEARGVSLSAMRDGSIRPAFQYLRKALADCVHGWKGDFRTASGQQIPFTPHNRDCLARSVQAAGEILEAARRLGVQIREAEEGNLRSSSGGGTDETTPAPGTSGN